MLHCGKFHITVEIINSPPSLSDTILLLYNLANTHIRHVKGRMVEAFSVKHPAGDTQSIGQRVQGSVITKLM